MSPLDVWTLYHFFGWMLVTGLLVWRFRSLTLLEAVVGAVVVGLWWEAVEGWCLEPYLAAVRPAWRFHECAANRVCDVLVDAWGAYIGAETGVSWRK